MTDQGDPIEAGKAAWARLQDHGRRSWDDWLAVARALAVGRSAALKAAGTNRPVGTKYNREMGRWLAAHDLDGVNNQERYRAISCLENLDAIEAWRATLSEVQRSRWNHPGAVWAHWKRARATAEPPPRQVRSDKPTRGYTRHVSFDGETIKRAATALRENWSNDTIRLAIVCLQAAFRDESDLWALLPPPALPRQKPAVRPAIEPAAVMQVPA